METSEVLYTQYESAIKEVLAYYLHLYDETYPDHQDLSSGIEFLARHNEPYKEQIRTIATNTIQELGSVHNRMYQKVYKQNQQAMNALLNEIFNVAIGI